MPTIYWWPIAAVVALVAYELYSVLKDAPRPLSISQIMWLALGVTVKCPHGQYFKRSIVGGVALAFAFGFLMGHFFA